MKSFYLVTSALLGYMFGETNISASIFLFGLYSCRDMMINCVILDLVTGNPVQLLAVV